MSQIIFAIRHAPQSEQLFHWQLAVNAVFAGGSLTAGLFNLSGLMALSIARSVLSRAAVARRRAAHHA